MVLAILGVHGEALGVAAQVSGQAGLVGDYLNGVMPMRQLVQEWRAPLGLTLEARPVNNLAVLLDLRLGFNAFPTQARSLGNLQSGQTELAQTYEPFALVGGRGERTDPLLGSLAYLEYSSEFGLFRVGRMPTHWGLGLWRHDGGRGPNPEGRWLVEGGSASAFDGVEVTIDFRDNLLFKASWEKMYEGSNTSRADDADAWTVGLLVSNEQIQVVSSGFQKEVGIAYSRYSAPDTALNVVDLFTRLNYGAFGVEGEILYVDGSSSSNAYEHLGGPRSCEKLNEGVCETYKKRNLDSLAFLAKFHFRLFEEGQTTSSVTGGRLLPTSQMTTNNRLGTWLGFVTGDQGAFESQTSAQTEDDISGGMMHPNIRPALLMFGAPVDGAPGMPGDVVRNAWFVRGEYRFDQPEFGSIIPAVIWGRLQQERTDGAVEGFGRDSDLGIEVDAAYEYTTRDWLTFGMDLGVWLPGAAWAKRGSEGPDAAYGLRARISTQF